MSELKLPSLNDVTLCGRLVADPHALVAKGDRPGAAFTLAVNRYRVGKPTVTSFIDCIAWGQPAEILTTYCVKGSAVLIHGSLAQHEKQQAKGPSIKVLQVSVAAVSLLDRKSPDAPTVA